MRRIAASLTALGWASLFAAWAVAAILVVEDGGVRALAAVGIPLDESIVGSLAGRAVLGGLCFGASVVAALFVTVALSLAVTTATARAHVRFLSEMAHGGALGLGTLVMLKLAVSEHAGAFALSVGVLALLVASLVGLRFVLADPVVVPVSARVVARRMAVAAAANSNVVRFPYYRAGGAA